MKDSIFRDKFVELDPKDWLPIWRATLNKKGECPLTGGEIYRSTGSPKVKARYRIGGKTIERELKVLFEENSPSLTSESSECYGAFLHIRNNSGKVEEFEFLGINN